MFEQLKFEVLYDERPIFDITIAESGRLCLLFNDKFGVKKIRHSCRKNTETVVNQKELDIIYHIEEVAIYDTGI